MASKSSAKLVEVDEHVSVLIDRGYEVDTELKNLTFEDKGIKKMLADNLEEKFGEDTTIVARGQKGQATITVSEKYVVVGDAEAIESTILSAKEGLLGEAVKTSTSVNIPECDMGRAVEILLAAGIGVTVEVGISVDPGAYRALVEGEHTTARSARARDVLKSILEKKTGYRVSYKKV